MSDREPALLADQDGERSAATADLVLVREQLEAVQAQLTELSSSVERGLAVGLVRIEGRVVDGLGQQLRGAIQGASEGTLTALSGDADELRTELRALQAEVAGSLERLATATREAADANRATSTEAVRAELARFGAALAEREEDGATAARTEAGRVLEELHGEMAVLSETVQAAAADGIDRAGLEELRTALREAVDRSAGGTVAVLQVELAALGTSLQTSLDQARSHDAESLAQLDARLTELLARPPIADALGPVRDDITTLQTSLRTALEEARSQDADSLEQVRAQLTELLGRAPVDDAIGSLRDDITALETSVQAAVQAAAAAAAEDTIAREATSLAQIGAQISLLGQTAVDAVTTVRDDVTSLETSLSASLAETRSQDGDALQQIGTQLTELLGRAPVDDVIGSLRDDITAVQTAVQAAVQAAADEATAREAASLALFGAQISLLGQTAVDAVMTVRDDVTSLQTSVGESLAEARSQDAEAFEHVGTQLTELLGRAPASDAIGSLRDDITTLEASVQAAVQATAEEATAREATTAAQLRTQVSLLGQTALDAAMTVRDHVTSLHASVVEARSDDAEALEQLRAQLTELLGRAPVDDAIGSLRDDITTLQDTVHAATEGSIAREAATLAQIGAQIELLGHSAVNAVITVHDEVTTLRTAVQAAEVARTAALAELGSGLESTLRGALDEAIAPLREEVAGLRTSVGAAEVAAAATVAAVDAVRAEGAERHGALRRSIEQVLDDGRVRASTENQTSDELQASVAAVERMLSDSLEASARSEREGFDGLRALIEGAVADLRSAVAEQSRQEQPEILDELRADLAEARDSLARLVVNSARAEAAARATALNATEQRIDQLTTAVSAVLQAQIDLRTLVREL